MAGMAGWLACRRGRGVVGSSRVGRRREPGLGPLKYCRSLLLVAESDKAAVVLFDTSLAGLGWLRFLSPLLCGSASLALRTHLRGQRHGPGSNNTVAKQVAGPAMVDSASARGGSRCGSGRGGGGRYCARLPLPIAHCSRCQVFLLRRLVCHSIVVKKRC